MSRFKCYQRWQDSKRQTPEAAAEPAIERPPSPKRSKQDAEEVSIIEKEKVISQYLIEKVMRHEGLLTKREVNAAIAAFKPSDPPTEDDIEFMHRCDLPVPEVPLYHDTRLPPGWRREVQERRYNSKIGPVDVWIYDQAGRVFKSREDLERHVTTHGIEGIDPAKVDFSIYGVTNPQTCDWY